MLGRRPAALHLIHVAAPVVKTHIWVVSAVVGSGSTKPSWTHHLPLQIASTRNLPLGAPDVLEEAVALGEAVEGIVALTHGADETRQSVDDVLALDGTAVLVDLGDGDLARAVVLGPDDSARRRALAGDVTGRGPGVSKIASRGRGNCRRA